MIRRKSILPARTTISENYSGEPAFILCADDHIQNGRPKCRKDLYTHTIFKKLQFRMDYAEKHNIKYILNAGDLGEKSYFIRDGIGWNAAIYNRYVRMLKNMGIKNLVVAGNHDLPGHDIRNIHESALGSLILAGSVKLLNNHEPEHINNINVYGCSWDQKIPKPAKDKQAFRNILVIHKMIIENIPLWPGQIAINAKEFLKKCSKFDLVVSGDNHNTFTIEKEGSILVNPGSMLRRKTDQFSHKPCFFVYYPEKNQVQKIFYNFEAPENVISNTHIKNKNKRTERSEKYSKAVQSADFSKLTSLQDNINHIFDENGVSLRLREITERFLNFEYPVQNKKKNHNNTTTRKTD